jgi:6-phosphogluconate dehydrogenase
MQLGMIGLGRMGANLVRRLMHDGHECVVYDVDHSSVEALEKEGAIGAGSLQEFVDKLSLPRAAWVMVPAAFAGKTIDDLADLMAEGDIVIDGGNTYYRDDIDRAARLSPRGLHYVDVGTSGGVFGLERGFCLMIGGEDEVVTHLDPCFGPSPPASTRRNGHRAGRGKRPSPSTATCTAVRSEPGTSSRWFTTASNTDSWPPTPRV